LNGWQGGLWVGDYAGRTVDEIDPSNGHVTTRISLGGRPYATTIVGQTQSFPGETLGLADYRGRVWSTTEGDARGHVPIARVYLVDCAAGVIANPQAALPAVE